MIKMLVEFENNYQPGANSKTGLSLLTGKK